MYSYSHKDGNSYITETVIGTSTSARTGTCKGTCTATGKSTDTAKATATAAETAICISLITYTETEAIMGTGT